jgi:cyclic pyranopterin phosphate synthase
MNLTHVDTTGKALMVDVGEKPVVKRLATAAGKILLQSATLQLIKDNALQKGDVLATARIAGIMAAKQTDQLIPLCHSLNIEQVTVEFNLVADGIEIVSTAKLSGKTGVEMEALTAVSVAALTIYDMCKAVDKKMCIENIHLREKKKSKIFKVMSVNTSKNKGEIKTTVPEITLLENYGVEGDAHAGDWHRQISLLAAEDIARTKIGFGEFAENITTYGINLPQLPLGTKLYLDEVVLEITQIGKECHGGCAIKQKIGDCIMPRRGVFAKVIKGGKVSCESNCYYYL